MKRPRFGGGAETTWKERWGPQRGHIDHTTKTMEQQAGCGCFISPCRYGRMSCGGFAILDCGHLSVAASMFRSRHSSWTPLGFW